MNKIFTNISAGKFTILLLLLTILSFQQIKSQQDPIDQYDGIPLIVYPERLVPNFTGNNYDQLKNMGVYGVVAPDVINQTYLNSFSTHSLKAIPQYWSDTTNNQHLIERYTNAHYTVWEAEGTDPSKGKVTLYRGPGTIKDSNGDTVYVIAGGTGVTNGEEIIIGPGYPQDVDYDYPEQDAIVDYTVEYLMKIEPRDQNPPQENPNDIVCTIRVTNLKNEGHDEVTVVEKDVKVSDFQGWGNWMAIDTSYEFNMSTSEEGFREFGIKLLPKAVAQCVEFKVIWRGLSYLNLYVDKITVSDLKGRRLINTSGPSFDIANLVQAYINNPTIIGWYGTDEPISIDNYEPFRVVDYIIDSVSNLPQNNYPIRLHASYTGGLTGTYSNYNPIDTFALDEYADLEFWLRAHPKNIQVNTYIYYNPFVPWPEYPEWRYRPDWQTADINYAIDYYNRINDFDTSFSFSTQSGGYYNYDDNCVFQDTSLVVPSTKQINYAVNLGLLYGARELRCDPFFSSIVCNDQNKIGVAGLINAQEQTTGNYDFYKNTIIPRLNGLLGKTLKKIHQKDQFSNVDLPVNNPIAGYNWLESIHYKYGDGPSYHNHIDLGFFETNYGSYDIPYFMVVDRWYNDAPGDTLAIHINKTGSGYHNWNITNFIDSTMKTIVDEGDIIMPQLAGDARLFKVYPVIRDGGSLDANETIYFPTTLMNDMTIENGVTLTVNATYNCYANIYIKGNGQLKTVNGDTINFYNSKGIIAEGNPGISGTSANKLTLDFGSTTSGMGIQILPNTYFIMDYCVLKNAYNLVSCNSSQFQTVISYCNF